MVLIIGLLSDTYWPHPVGVVHERNVAASPWATALNWGRRAGLTASPSMWGKGPRPPLGHCQANLLSLAPGV